MSNTTTRQCGALLSWVPALFEIDWGGCTRTEVEGLTAGPFGLHFVNTDDGVWKVTHLPTGYRIWAFPRLEEATAFCNRIFPLLPNWETVTDHIDDPALNERVRQIASEVRGDARA